MMDYLNFHIFSTLDVNFQLAQVLPSKHFKFEHKSVPHDFRIKYLMLKSLNRPYNRISRHPHIAFSPYYETKLNLYKSYDFETNFVGLFSMLSNAQPFNSSATHNSIFYGTLDNYYSLNNFVVGFRFISANTSRFQNKQIQNLKAFKFCLVCNPLYNYLSEFMPFAIADIDTLDSNPLELAVIINFCFYIMLSILLYFKSPEFINSYFNSTKSYLKLYSSPKMLY
ncbi:MAG: hypothetical protein LBF12_06230 [Christensenellaceae bacterium]|nr:hypothetical protein [Christensenellaceae bacterium]